VAAAAAVVTRHFAGVWSPIVVELDAVDVGECVWSAATTVGGGGPLASVRPMLRFDER
jgi:hypothetical protein